MEIVDLFLREHAFVHSSEVAAADFNTDWLVADLTEEQWRARPHGFNSIAWMFWHMTRVEDGCVSLIVAGEPQLLDDDRAALLQVDHRGDGDGMSKAEVAEISAGVDIDALQAYRNDVGRRTREHARALWTDRWSEAITEADVQHAVDAGVVTAEYSIVVGKPREMLLFWWGLHHSIYHLGQAAMIRGNVTAAAV
jgi:hypothetical protein